MTISAPAALFLYCNENISMILALSIVKISAYQYNRLYNKYLINILQYGFNGIKKASILFLVYWPY
jgi:hypothetical protein